MKTVHKDLEAEEGNLVMDPGQVETEVMVTEAAQKWMDTAKTTTVKTQMK